jgi:hypothetical protein
MSDLSTVHKNGNHNVFWDLHLNSFDTLSNYLNIQACFISIKISITDNHYFLKQNKKTIVEFKK